MKVPFRLYILILVGRVGRSAEAETERRASLYSSFSSEKNIVIRKKSRGGGEKVAEEKAGEGVRRYGVGEKGRRRRRRRRRRTHFHFQMWGVEKWKSQWRRSVSLETRRGLRVKGERSLFLPFYVLLRV